MQLQPWGTIVVLIGSIGRVELAEQPSKIPLQFPSSRVCGERGAQRMLSSGLPLAVMMASGKEELRCVPLKWVRDNK